MTIAWRLVTSAEKMHTSFMKISHTDKRVNASLSLKVHGVCSLRESSNHIVINLVQQGLSSVKEKNPFGQTMEQKNLSFENMTVTPKKRTYLYMLL